MGHRRLGLLAAIVVLLGLVQPAWAAAPVAPPELPLLHNEVRAGTVTRTPVGRRAPRARVIDGRLNDWIGTPARFAGASRFAAGEFIYTDHLFDAYGPEAGNDKDRLAVLDPLADAIPETYRLDPIGQIDPFDEVGVPVEYPLATSDHYGDADFQAAADLLEVRAAATKSDINVLVRTTTLTGADQTAVLLLADTVPGSATRAVPFASQLTTTRADIAVLLHGTRAKVVDLATGRAINTNAVVATNPDGFDNAIEARLPRRLLEGRDGKLALALATGRVGPGDTFAALPGTTSGARLANVAFRPDEPVRTWFDKQQALALAAGNIDAFFASIDLAASVRGVSERISLRPGSYYERIFESSAQISTEGGTDGVFQPYGVYVPLRYGNPSVPLPATFWMHWRGGQTHAGATVAPRIMRDQGEGHGGFVFAPRGRGTSSWYLGEGMVDFNEVWANSMSTFKVDASRVYVSGHSMGGWASWLLPLLYPDRFAGAFPVEGPLTQGAWTGIDFPGCDDLDYEDYSPCYVNTNDGDARTQHTMRLVDNLRNVPMAIYQGAIDELVPVSGVTLQVSELHKRGYQYRYYVFPNYEHYTHPIIDEWLEGARYLDGFTRPLNPPHVTYVRDMPFERTVETGPSLNKPVKGLSFDFDHAYWMSELTPVDPVGGTARFDGESLALAGPPTIAVPEAGGPFSLGQAGPYVMVGQRRVPNPLASAPTRTNAFRVTLTGARRVALDLARMRLRSSAPLAGRVTTDSPLELRLIGAWTKAPTVRIGNARVATTLAGGVLSISLPAGVSEIVIA